MELLTDIKNYKILNERIADLEKKIDEVMSRKLSIKLEQKLNSTGLTERLGAKLNAMKQVRYELECKSIVIRLLAVLHLI